MGGGISESKSEEEIQIKEPRVVNRGKIGKYANGIIPPEDAEEIRKAYARGDGNQYEIADMYGVCQSTISQVINFKGHYSK